MVTKDLHAAAYLHIEEEHGRLRHILDGVLQTVTSRAASAKVVGELLVELAEQVTGHFRHEEQGGFFVHALERAPRLSGRASELLGQHPEMLEQLESLRQHAGRHEATKAWWDKLDELFRQFLFRFNEHEAGEHDLLQQAFCDDIGAED